jgi:acyl-coenzyme A thioesterase PaaI-like protein
MTVEETRDPLSADRSAQEHARILGAALPSGETIAPEALELVDRIRDLVEAAVLTDVPTGVRADIAERIAGITEELKAAQRDDVVYLVRYEDGRFEHLTQAATGRLNPQAMRLDFETSPPPAPGEPPRSAEVHGKAVLTAQHGGPPGRVHGGLVATMLDQLLGYASSSAGCPGMTAGLDIRYRRATPYGVELELTGRWERAEGRKNFVTGEIRVDGKVTAEATGVFINSTPGMSPAVQKAE